ncbi:MAG: hypothetical protein DELT_02935 [Desulfovibrio sp.]
MHEALQYFSRLGPFKKKVTAFDIKSREYYRDILPLICPDTKRPVTWVKGIFENGSVKRRSHFRVLSGKRRKDYLSYQGYRKRRTESVQSDEHKKAKEVLLEALSHKMATSKTMFWSFSYNEVTDFYFKGNILFNATSIEEEYYVKTISDKKLFLDIAVLGESLDENPLVLFGVEIEKGHKFNGLKAILCKGLGFPFVSVDISEMTLDEINIEWAEKTLTLTTKDDKMGFRKNFVYLPPVLYPLYVRHDHMVLNIEDRHSYIVFADEGTIKKIENELIFARSKLGYDQKSLNIALVNGQKSRDALHQVQLAGETIGEGWEQLNNSQFLRITVPRPNTKEGRSTLHKFYLLMAKSLLGNDALVGYKYTTGSVSAQSESSGDIWIVAQVFPGERKRAIPHRFLPKLLATPLLAAATHLGLE